MICRDIAEEVIKITKRQAAIMMKNEAKLRRIRKLQSVQTYFKGRK